MLRDVYTAGTLKDTLEKAWKDHQMMRNSRKMRRAKGGKNKIFNK